MIETEANLERALNGLPEAPVTIPEHILVACKNGKIQYQDLVPNLYSYVSSEHRVIAEDPVTGYDEIARIHAMRDIAKQTIEMIVGLEDNPRPWQS